MALIMNSQLKLYGLNISNHFPKIAKDFWRRSDRKMLIHSEDEKLISSHVLGYDFLSGRNPYISVKLI